MRRRLRAPRRRAWLLLLAVGGCLASPPPTVAPLLDAPTAFTIDVEGSSGPGRVLSAQMVGDSLAVGYAYPAPEGERRGRLAGTLADSVLTGHYDTHGAGTHFRGPLRLVFHADGSADGVWNDGEGTVSIQPR